MSTRRCSVLDSQYGLRHTRFIRKHEPHFAWPWAATNAETKEHQCRAPFLLQQVLTNPQLCVPLILRGFMSRELTAITVLIALFLVGTLRSVNMNVRGFVAAFTVDIPVVGMTNRKVIAGFPGIFLSLLALSLSSLVSPR